LNFVEVCRKLISIDTSPGSNTLEIARYLAGLAAEMGLEAEVLEEMHNGVVQANIIVRTEKFQTGTVDFLLETHLDTVDPDHFALWKKNDFNPFEAAIEDGKIYGLGAADVKLDFLCKLKVLQKFKGRTTGAMRPVLIGTFGEETGMQGALKLIRKNKINAKYAVIGETTDLQIANASKGYAVVEIRLPFGEEEKKYKESRLELESITTETKVFSGKSAHSSTPHLGDNAVQKLFDFLQKMPENMVLIDMDGGTRFNMVPNQAMIELELTSHVPNLIITKLNKIFRVLLEVESDMKLFRNPLFEPDHSTLSIGLVRSNDELVRIGGSCRVLPNITQEQYEGWMDKIHHVCEEVGGQFLVLDYKKPFYTDEKSILIKTAQSILQKMGLDPQCRALASTNEASLLSRLGVECLCIGAGKREGNIHTPQEHVKIEDLEKVTAFYEQLVERFCV
jgi:succinyl-diaminopimelate desuccinylase